MTARKSIKLLSLRTHDRIKRCVYIFGVIGRLLLCGEQMSDQLTETSRLSGRIKSQEWPHGLDGA